MKRGAVQSVGFVCVMLFFAGCLTPSKLLIERAARGDADAQYELGRFLERLTRRAEGGNERAQNNLGVMYHQGLCEMAQFL